MTGKVFPLVLSYNGRRHLEDIVQAGRKKTAPYSLRQTLEMIPISVRNLREPLNIILEESAKVADLMRDKSFEEFSCDPATYEQVVSCIQRIDEAAHGIPTIVRVKYALLPWKEIAALKAEFMAADAHLRPRVVWKISTEALPRIRPLVASLIEEIEK